MISGASFRWLVFPVLTYLNAYVPLLNTSPPQSACVFFGFFWTRTFSSMWKGEGKYYSKKRSRIKAV